MGASVSTADGSGGCWGPRDGGGDDTAAAEAYVGVFALDGAPSVLLDFHSSSGAAGAPGEAGNDDGGAPPAEAKASSLPALLRVPFSGPRRPEGVRVRAGASEATAAVGGGGPVWVEVGDARVLLLAFRGRAGMDGAIETAVVRDLISGAGEGSRIGRAGAFCAAAALSPSVGWDDAAAAFAAVDRGGGGAVESAALHCMLRALGCPLGKPASAHPLLAPAGDAQVIDRGTGADVSVPVPAYVRAGASATAEEYEALLRLVTKRAPPPMPVRAHELAPGAGPGEAGAVCPADGLLSRPSPTVVALALGGRAASFVGGAATLTRLAEGDGRECFAPVSGSVGARWQTTLADRPAVAQLFESPVHGSVVVVAAGADTVVRHMPDAEAEAGELFATLGVAAPSVLVCFPPGGAALDADLGKAVRAGREVRVLSRSSLARAPAAAVAAAEAAKRAEADEIERSRSAGGGTLRVHVRRAEGLKKTDRSGKTDPYARFTVGRVSAQTAHLRKTLDPVWDETLELHLDALPLNKRMTIDMFDWERVGKDELVSSTSMMLGSGVLQPGQTVERQAPLGGNADTYGTVFYALQWTPGGKAGGGKAAPAASSVTPGNPDAPDAGAAGKAGALHVHVRRAAGLKKTDRSGKTDPYVRAVVGDAAAQTAHLRKTLDPEWDETLVLQLDEAPKGSTELTLELYDWERVGSDDLVSTASELLAMPVAREGTECEFSSALGGDSAEFGIVHFSVRWVPK